MPKVTKKVNKQYNNGYCIQIEVKMRRLLWFSILILLSSFGRISWTHGGEYFDKNKKERTTEYLSKERQDYLNEISERDIRYSTESTWNWKDEWYWIHYPDPGGGYFQVPSPFYSGIPGLENFDYEENDGWLLMARDFGDEVTPATQIPFFILYNKYRGIMRFFGYLNLPQTYSGGVITLGFTSASRTKCINGEGIIAPLSKHDLDQKNAVLTRLQNGWNYADFHVLYDPNTANVVEPVFHFEIRGLISYNLNLDGNINLAQTNIGVSHLPVTTGISRIIGGVNSAYSYFKGVDDLKNGIKKRANKQKNEVLKNNLLSMVDNPLIKYLPYASAAYGFLDALIGGQGNQQPVPLVLEGQIQLEGQLEASELVKDVLLRVPGANHNGKPNYLPIWDFPLGVFNLVNHTQPPVIVSVNNLSICIGCDDEPYNYFDIIRWGTNDQVSYIVNPYSGVILKDLRAAYAFSIKAPQFPSPQEYTDYINGHIANGHYVLTGSSDEYDGNWYQYRTRYVDFDYIKNIKLEIPRTYRDYPMFKEVGWSTVPTLINATFYVPGKPADEDIVFVANYDLWWPDQLSPTPEAPNMGISVDLVLGGTISTPTPIAYEASNSIFTRTQINSGCDVSMHAGNYIKLGRGFMASSGSEYRAHIGGLMKPNLEDGGTTKGIELSKVTIEKSNEIDLENSLNKNNPVVPTNWELMQNYPNPFNPTTTLRYGLKEDVQVSLKIYNVLGQEVRTLVNEKQSAGFKSVLWDGKNNEGAQVQSGIYIYRIVAGNYVKAKKMMLVK